MDHWYWAGGFQVAVWGTLILQVATGIVRSIVRAAKEGKK